MFIATTKLKFEHGKGNFTMEPSPTMYRETDIPSHIKKLKHFKECEDAGLISGGKKVVQKLDKELTSLAKSLGITFDDNINQNILEAKVKDAQEEQALALQASKTTTPVVIDKIVDSNQDEAELEQKRELIAQLADKGVTANVGWKLETLEAKLAEQE